jgi:hypothetical protein
MNKQSIFRVMALIVVMLAVSINLNAQTKTITEKPKTTVLSLSETSVTMDEGTARTLVVSGLAKGETATWTSSNTAVATVGASNLGKLKGMDNNKGFIINAQRITAKAAGTATITATVGTKKATCVVTVKAVVLTEQQRRNQIKDGLKGISTSSSNFMNGTLFNAPSEKLTQFVINGNNAYKIVKQQQSITNAPMCILSDKVNDPNIYPGAIVYANSGLTEGTPTPLAGVSRNKVRIYSSIGTTIKEVNPNSADVQTAINQIKNELGNITLTAAANNVSSQIYTSKEHMMLDFKCKASFLGSSINAGLNTTSDKSKLMLTINVEQDFYTMGIGDEYKDDPAMLFANNVTWADIRNASGGKPLAIIMSVTYGRRIYNVKTEETSNCSLNGYQKFNYSTMADMSAKQELTSTQKSASSILVERGGGSLGTSLFGTSTEQEVKDALKTNSAYSVNTSTQLVPVSYTLAYLTGSSISTQVDPTFNGKYYTVETLQKLPSKISTSIKVDAGDKATQKVYVRLIAAKLWTVKPGQDPTYTENVVVLEQAHDKGESKYWDKIIDYSGKNQYMEGYDDGLTFKLEVELGGKRMIDTYIRMDGKNVGKNDVVSGPEKIGLRISGTTSSMYLNKEGGHTQPAIYH